LLPDFERTHIILDTLDESTDQNQVVTFLEHMVKQNSSNLHILATSRKEPELDSLIDITTETVEIKNDADIQLYIQEVLENDKALKTQPTQVKNDISEVLMRNANGMYAAPHLYLNVDFPETKCLKVSMGGLSDGCASKVHQSRCC
jgi:ankyrin repeat domain-containing protein 50